MLWKQAGFEWRPALTWGSCASIGHTPGTQTSDVRERGRDALWEQLSPPSGGWGPQPSLQANIQSKSESGPSFCHQVWRIEIITNRDRRNIEHLKAQLNRVILFLSPISFLASTLPVVTESGSYSGWLYEKPYYSLWILISSHLDTERGGRDGSC